MDITKLGFLLFLAILPVILILLFVYNKDKSKEPLHLLLILFVSGFGSCVLVLLISSLMEKIIPFMDYDLPQMNFLQVLFYAFIGVALVEELCKWIMVRFIAYNHKEFDEVYDIIVYAIFVSLGFAFVENIIYVMSSVKLITAFLRAISAVPSHACDAVFMGYYLSIAKQYAERNDKESETKNIILSIVIPTVLHGIYDFCIMSGYTILFVVFIVFVIFLYIFSIQRLKFMADANRKFRYKNKFCKNCGAPIRGDFCGNCGTKQ